MYKVKITRNIATQVGMPFSSPKVQQTQIPAQTATKEIRCPQVNNSHTMTELNEKFLANKETLIELSKEFGILPKQVFCSQCNEIMRCVQCDDRSDGFEYECRGKTVKRHRVEISIRQGSWFEKSNLTHEEILKLTYWWTVGLKESQIAQQLRLSPNTAVDLCMFCREVCEVAIAEKYRKLGGIGKRVQIYESKTGRRG